MSKAVKTKRKIKKAREQKNVTPCLESMIFFMSSEKHLSDKFLEKYADDQLKYYCNNEDAKYINEYHLSRGIRRKIYYDWLKRSPYLRDRHEMCLEIIGLRRERTMERANALVLKLRQYQYDPGFGEAEARDAEMKKRDNEKKMGDIKVVFPVNEQVIDREKYKPIKARPTDDKCESK